MQKAKYKTINFLYTHILKEILFKFDPEKIHDRFVEIGKMLGKYELTKGLTRGLFLYKNPILEQDICGLHFNNPIGLAAGFDKNGHLTQILPEVGFGFMEVGSVTAQMSPGNPRPRLWRLKQSKSIVVNYGLMNDGAEVIQKRLSGLPHKMPIGISIAKTNCQANANDAKGIEDYVLGTKTIAQEADYLTINISCPNAFGGQPFNDAKRLELLLGEIDKVSNDKPVFIKMNPDLSDLEVDQIIGVVKRHKINGFVCSNLTKPRNNPAIKEKTTPEVGGISGKVLEDSANHQIAHIYKQTKGEYIIVGCGGVFSAQDAYLKIKMGASLIQLITGMLFEGPQLIGQINLGLVELLKKDGYTSISQAIGKGL